MQGSRIDRLTRLDSLRGFSIIELLIALSILGILLGIGAALVRTPSASLYANDIRALIQQARFEAVKLNRPVAIVWNEPLNSFVAGVGPLSDPCEFDAPIVTADSRAYARLTIDPGFGSDDGLVWLPSGQARDCAFGTFPQTIATINDGRLTQRVTVTLTGRVTIQ